MKVEGEDGENIADAVVLLLVAHVGAAERGLPESQVIVALRKWRPLKGDKLELASFRVW